MIRLDDSPQIIIPDISIQWRRRPLNGGTSYDTLFLFDEGECIDETIITWSKGGGVEWRFNYDVYLDKQ